FCFLVCLLLAFQSPSYGVEGNNPSSRSDLNYVIEPCCTLCSAVLDPLTYETGRLSGMRFLTDGKNAWLFRTDDDFMSTFGPTPANAKELASVIKMLNQRGIELAILYIPTRGLIESKQILESSLLDYNLRAAKESYTSALATLRGAGAIVPDMSQAFNGL